MNTTHSPVRKTFAFALMAMLMAGTWLHAGTAGIQDNGGFFSDAAKADAKGNITELQRSMKKDVEVETFATVPDDVKSGVNLQDKAAVSAMFSKWGLQRFHSQGVNGVYILMVKEPGHLQVEVGNDTQKQAFTLADRDELAKRMLAKLRTKDYDGALREGVAFVATTMRHHYASSHAGAAQAPAPVSQPTHWNNTPPQQHSESHWGLISLVIFLVIVFVVVRIIGKVLHMLFGGGSISPPMGGAPMGGYGGGYGGGGGGGGFLRSLMGGVLGGAAGSWMYDSFFGSHGSSAYGAPPQQNYDQGGGGGFTGQDTDASGSGGSFGGSDSGGGGGGDFGGGGGGDSGGGGGGDSGGGGGGDF